MRLLTIGALFGILIVIGVIVTGRRSGPTLSIPTGGEIGTTTVVVESPRAAASPTADPAKPGEIAGPSRIQKEVMMTDGVRHSVPLDEIVSGGLAPDDIPSIDNPKFVSVAAAQSLLDDTEPGVAFERGGTARFYPFQILVWHEIVNDVIAGNRVLVTYCPLCLSGIVFDPIVGGERVEFGTSGKLWNSNLVMYDRKTQTLWSQILGEAIMGEMTGTALAVLASDQMRFGIWRRMHPDGEVLSRDTGTRRFYGNDPYIRGGFNYYTDPELIVPVGNTDARLDPKTFVLGIVVNGKAKAYAPEAVRSVGEFRDTFEGENLLIRWVDDIEAVRMYEALPDGTLTRVNPFPNFWFSWAAAHPQTELYK